MSNRAEPGPNDATHSLLAKARPISQTSITAFTQNDPDPRQEPHRLPRSTYGTYEVQEVETQTALTDCNLPEDVYSLNPYTGCSHDCTYCYVPDVAHLERDNWGTYAIVKRNLPTLLSRELKTKPQRTIFCASATDPYQPAEATHRITQRCLELIAREQWPLSLLTRSPLIQRDLDILQTLPELSVGMSIPTLDDDARQIIEPGAPPIHGRLNTIRTLADAGFEPYVNLAPAYPLTNNTKPDQIAQTFAQAGVAEVRAGRWRYLDTVLPALEHRIQGTPLEGPFRDAVENDAYYDRLFTQLRGAFRRANIPFREM